MRFFQAHPEFVLISLALLFLVILATSFFWGITTLIAGLNQAISAGSAAQGAAAGFDLKGAQALDLKGALQQ